MTRPPLELAVSLRGPGGQRWRLAPDGKASDRPLDLSFSTEAGEGFHTGQVALRRPYDGEFPDLALLNEVVAEGQDGQVAYEGRIQGTPRSLNQGGPEIRLDCAGPMSLARSQPFTDLLIDRDLGAWSEPPLRARAVDVGAGAAVEGPAVDADDTGGPALRLTRPTSGNLVRCYAVYRAPAGTRVASVYYRYESKAPAAAGCDLTVQSADHGGASGGSTPDLITSIDQSGSGTLTATTPYPFVRLRFWNDPAPTAEQFVAFRQLVTVGDHGLSVGAGDPSITLSEAITYLFGRYAPQLDTSQIVQNHYPVPHAVWREPTTAHDAVKQLNVYSQWALGAWENRRVQYEPFDLSSYDWEVQAGINGVEVETQGVTVEDAFNGVIVQFQDFIGQDQIITPDQAEDLRDTNPAIAANQWGERAWTTLQLSNPQTPDGAIQIARMYLADLNRPKFPSTITVPGHIRDRHGRWQQAWRPRANQTISVRNHPNDAPRLITSTSWQGNQLQITTDNALNRMEAILSRLDQGRNPTGG